MATSGTVGSTIINVAKFIDHAVRRCGLSPATLTPEQLEASQECLFTLITSTFSNRGINLWCVDKELVELSANKSVYTLNPGTIDVLSVNYLTSTSLLHTGDMQKDYYKATFTGSVAVKLMGVYYNATRDHDFVVEVSNDGTTWSIAADLGTVQGSAGHWTWHEIEPAYSTPYFRLRDTRPDPNNNFLTLNVDTVRLCSSFSEVEVSSMNRDTFNALPNKRIPGRPSQYYFNKTLVPELALNPEPNDTTAFLVVRRHRQIQDIGALQNEIEIPNRWYEAVIWGLSDLLGYELPDVDATRRLEITAHAAAALKNAEDGETDLSPFYMAPNISGYTK